MNNNLYDTDLYDKAQECVESTLKYSCVRVFVDEILPSMFAYVGTCVCAYVLGR